MATSHSSVSPLEQADFNQSPPFEDVDLFSLDGPLGDAVTRAGLARDGFAAFGKTWGSAEMAEHGRLANEHKPRLKIADAKGHRADRVEFHPSYHALMTASVAAGVHCSAFEGRETVAPVTARAARQYMIAGVEAGHMCPITMTHAALPALKANAELFAQVKPKIVTRAYDPRFRPWFEKDGITIGMGMTERQGGTDVRANITRAEAAGDHAIITGHKWFMSAPMCDAFLVLAQTDGGLGCYFLPRHRPDGSVNGLRFRRLKEKLGNASNASSEVEFSEAYAVPVGAPGAGVKTIIEMVQWTRLDCAVSSAGLMRMGLAMAIHHARHRTVFQRHLIDQAAMRTLLADMALEMEATTALVFRLARAFDRQSGDASEAAYARLMTPVIKYLVCKRAPQFLYEAMEAQGGNGYVEDLPLARLYREAPLNAIWEGSGNVMALDMLRAVSRQPDAARAVLGMLATQAGEVCREAPALAQEIAAAFGGGRAEARARWAVEMLGKLAAVAALAEAGSAFAGPYAETRLQRRRVDQLGAVDLSGPAEAQLIGRAYQG